MSPSPETVAVNSPLSIIADIFSKRPQRQQDDRRSQSEDGFFQDVARYFSEVLADHLDAVPDIQDVDTPGKLARFRCMIQDTGIPNEVYVLDAGGENGRGCCAYSEGAAGGSPILGFDSTDYSKLRERQVVYATSVPGETHWHRQTRRRGSQDSFDNSASSLVETLSNQLHISHQNGSTRQAGSSASSPLPYKFPLPGVAHTGALVKTYPSSADGKEDTLKTTEVVEFIGVVDYSSYPTAGSPEDHPEASSSSSATLCHEQVKTLHAIYKLPSLASQSSRLEKSAYKETRDSLISRLADALCGDKVAAEWLLLSLLGRVQTRHGSLCVGQLPINLVLPQNTDNAGDVVKKVQAILDDILPSLVKLDFEVSKLNAATYSPESKEENLHSGVLQLPEGTTLLVDETGLGEGTLKDKGVKNVQALTTVISDQTLAYLFPYSSFTFETDLKIVVISKGKSLLPMECFVPVRPSTASSFSAASLQPTSGQLSSWRQLVSTTLPSANKNEAAFSIPEDMSELIQNDFVRMRQNKSVTQEDLVLRMTVARLVAQSYGKNELDKESWDATKELDDVRKTRLSK